MATEERTDEDLPWYGRFTKVKEAWACRYAHAGPRGRGKPRCPQDGTPYYCRCPNPFYVDGRRCGLSIPRHAKRGQASVGPSRLPLFCERCGGPHPWTKELLRPFEAEVESDATLSDADKEQRLRDINSVFLGLPAVNLPAPRVKMDTETAAKMIEIAGSVGEAVAKIFRAILVGG